MYGVLVVDDEYYVRASLINRTDWASLGLTIVGQAANGYEALDFFDELRPDIVIVDIRMPRMDGLTFLEQARGRDDRCRFIVLSGYSEFEYARSAFRCQVTDYLLKPVNPDELRSALARCIRTLDTYSASEADLPSRAGLEQAEIDRWLDDPTPRRDAVPRALAGAPCALLLAMLPGGKCSAGDRFAIKQALQGVLPADTRVTLSMRRGVIPQIRALISGRALREEDVCAAAIELLHRIGRSAYLTWSLTDGNIEDLHDDCQRAQEYRMLRGERAQIIRAGAVPIRPSAEERAWMGHGSRQFSDAAHEQDAPRARQALSELFAYPWSSPQALKWILKSLSITTQEYSLRQNVSPDSRVERITEPGFLMDFVTLEQLKTYVVETLMQFLFQPEKEHKPEVVEQIQRYIEKHLSDDLRMEALAKEFFLSVSYLSQLFKSKTGVPISSFIETRRMERAKLLLLQRNMSITQTALRVGYADSAYFTRAFKRRMGITPKKYQQCYGLRNKTQP